MGLSSVCFQAGTCPGGSDPFISWSYDGVGNRLSEARPTGTSYSYNPANDELTQAGPTVYTYDKNGNELSAGSRTFTYDLANRLKTTTLGSTTTTYSYDGDGKRLQASTGTQASKKTNFLWDVNRGLPQIALERDGNNSLIRRYSYGARRISQTAGNNTSYYLHDGLGSVANLTSSSGATQWTWTYEPFGSIRTEQKASGSQPDNLMRFTGEYLDPTGLYHLRARQYDPASGRFLARDPRPARPNEPFVSAYAYVANRPTAFIDPTGEQGWGRGCLWFCEDAVEAGTEAGEEVAGAVTDQVIRAQKWVDRQIEETTFDEVWNGVRWAGFVYTCIEGGTAGFTVAGPGGALVGCAAGAIAFDIASENVRTGVEAALEGY